MKRRLKELPALLLLALGAFGLAHSVHAQSAGTVSGLPVPRFVSLKNEKVNVRRGPAREHEVTWIFTRAGLPVEITAESDNWRRIRDSDGAEGWVYHSLLSGRRTALVSPSSQEKSFPLYDRADANGRVAAELQPGVLTLVRRCSAGWCRITGEGFDGYIEQTRLWGVYPNETVD